ncbi:MAG: hypothetical protein ACRD6W_03515 [Nitrososphaerales archaeon]
MRVPLEAYVSGEKTKVYSLVASVPFSPVDIDLSLLARGEWDAVKDRMRVWFLPRTEGHNDRPSCYIMIRKFDREQEIVTFAHIVMNLEAGAVDGAQYYFTIGILSNDDIRARAILGIFLGVPPIFHKRSEITLVEGRWRTDPATVMRFAANVHSAVAAQAGPGGEAYSLKFEPPADFLAKLKPGLDNWWDVLEGEDAAASGEDSPQGINDKTGRPS